jgi:hypothetical protein
MGYEYAFVSNSLLELPLVAQLFHSLQTAHSAGRATDISGWLRYVYAASELVCWVEDFLLKVLSICSYTRLQETKRLTSSLGFSNAQLF